MATALQKLLAVAAEGDPLELPFVAALAQLHYAQPDAPPPPPAGKASRKKREEPAAQGPTAARAVLNSTVTRLRSLVGRGYATRERVAKPIGALGSQLLGGRVDAATARELLGERSRLKPLPSSLGCRVAHITVRGGPEVAHELDPTAPAVKYFLALALTDHPTEAGGERDAAWRARAIRLVSEVVAAQPGNSAAVGLQRRLEAAPHVEL